jgi:predicted DNA-binding protein
MKRTQLYLDEEMARILETLSRQKGTTISELVRTSLREHYLQGKELDKVSLARDLTGIWKNRRDLKDIDATVRKLRKGSRLKRFQIG